MALGSQWDRVHAKRIEQLNSVIQTLGLQALQHSQGELNSFFARSEYADVLYFSGVLGAKLTFSGSQRENRVCFSTGVCFPEGCRLRGENRLAGNVAFWATEDELDAIYMPGTQFIAASLEVDVYERFASLYEKVTDRHCLSRSTVSIDRLSTEVQRCLISYVRCLHQGHIPVLTSQFHAIFLREILNFFSRNPQVQVRRFNYSGHARVVFRAREYIADNLHNKMSLQEIALAANTSVRTLQRAFEKILDSTPIEYILRLRLHRIRNDLISEREIFSTISLVAGRWGMSEPGRFSGYYKDLFGESPIQTRKLIMDVWQSAKEENRRQMASPLA